MQKSTAAFGVGQLMRFIKQAKYMERYFSKHESVIQSKGWMLSLTLDFSIKMFRRGSRKVGQDHSHVCNGFESEVNHKLQNRIGETMEQKTNASTAAERIVQLVGGTENIRAVTHCLTRLRFDLLSRECADDAQIKTIPEVLGIVFRAGQYQIVLNQNLYPVFNAIASRYPDMCRSIADESSSCGFGDEAAESRR